MPPGPGATHQQRRSKCSRGIAEGRRMLKALCNSSGCRAVARRRRRPANPPECRWFRRRHLRPPHPAIAPCAPLFSNQHASAAESAPRQSSGTANMVCAAHRSPRHTTSQPGASPSISRRRAACSVSATKARPTAGKGCKLRAAPRRCNNGARRPSRARSGGRRVTTPSWSMSRRRERSRAKEGLAAARHPGAAPARPWPRGILASSPFSSDAL